MSLATRPLVQLPVWLSGEPSNLGGLEPLILPHGFSLREYSPWTATGKLVQPHAWPSQEPSNLSGLEPDDPLWAVLRLLVSNNKDQPSLPKYLKNQLILVDSIKVIPLGLCNASLECLVSPLLFPPHSLIFFQSDGPTNYMCTLKYPYCVFTLDICIGIPFVSFWVSIVIQIYLSNCL